MGVFNIQRAHTRHTCTRLRCTNLSLCRLLALSWLAGQRVSRVESGRADTLTLFCSVDSFFVFAKKRNLSDDESCETAVSLHLSLAVFCLAETIFFFCFDFVCLTFRLIVVSLKVGGFWNFVASVKVCSFFRSRLIFFFR